MTVIDIISKAGLVLGRQDIVDYYSGEGEVGEFTYLEIMTFVKIVNLVINELACTYLPLQTEQTVTFKNGKFAYSSLNKKAIKIVNIYDSLGKKVAFTETAENIVLKEESQAKTLTVVYQFVPEEYFEDSELDYTEKDISPRVIAYGVAAEYCINQGMFEEAVMHHKRYVLSLEEMKSPKNSRIKNRSWL